MPSGRISSRNLDDLDSNIAPQKALQVKIKWSTIVICLLALFFTFTIGQNGYNEYKEEAL